MSEREPSFDLCVSITFGLFLWPTFTLLATVVGNWKIGLWVFLFYWPAVVVMVVVIGTAMTIFFNLVDKIYDKIDNYMDY